MRLPSAKLHARVALAMLWIAVCACLNAESARGAAQQAVSSAGPAGTDSGASTTAKKQPVVLDHVVAVINGDVILQSDVDEEMRFGVLQPFRFEPAQRTPHASLRRLIDRDLILQQMKYTQSQTQPPSEAELDKEIADLRRQIPECAQYHCESEEGWEAFLKAHGLTESEVVGRWRQRLLIFSFIQSRFGAGVNITQDQIEQYYEKELVPELIKRNVKPPPLKTVADRIREILLQQHVSAFLQDWLKSLKQEGSVSILDPAYGQLGTTGSGDESEGGR
jgi:peptidyl-prolyl cis-trans isomerase SurA